MEFKVGDSVNNLRLTGHEVFEISGLAQALADESPGGEVTVRAKREGSNPIEFSASVRLDTPQEVLYYRHGGILHYVLRQLLSEG